MYTKTISQQQGERVSCVVVNVNVAPKKERTQITKQGNGLTNIIEKYLHYDLNRCEYLNPTHKMRM